MESFGGSLATLSDRAMGLLAQFALRCWAVLVASEFSIATEFLEAS